MVFAAGLGTRLRPLTDTMPKALVPIDGTPILEHVFRRLIAAGFNEIIVNIHHFGEQIIHFLQEKQNFGINIQISDERDELLDTGGGILKAHPLLDGNEPFLVHNADILTDLDLRAFFQCHLNSNADATLLTAQRDTSRYLLFDNAGRMQGWTNAKTGEVKPDGIRYAAGMYRQLAFGGIHVLSPSIFDQLEKYATTRKFSIMPFYYNSCKSLEIRNYISENSYHWFDIGKPETLADAEAWIKQTK